MLKNKLWVLASIVLIIITGYFREYLFVNLNYELQFLYYNDDQSYNSIEFYRKFTYDQLWWGKWLLTGLFTLMYWALSIWVVFLLFRSMQFVRITTIAFVLVITVAGIAFGFILLSDSWDTPYRFARIFMGIVQSPIPVMALIPAFMLQRASAK